MKQLYVVGIGPGKADFMTAQAKDALEASAVILGYDVYVDLVRPLYPEKEYLTTGMTREIDRCRKALELAEEGNTVSLICSGDSGVYGMASPLLELRPSFPDVPVTVVPGVTAALSGAALLGAPLSSDFCVISLSTRLTKWETIEKRLRAAAEADLPVVLYNPASRSRTEEIRKARRVLVQSGKSPETVCGLARNIGRDGEKVSFCTLETLCSQNVDMFTTVFIGASATKMVGEHMVTPRGYEYSKTQKEEFCKTAPAENAPKHIFLFGGTTEARELADKLVARGDTVTVSVATEYGKELQSENPDVTVLHGRLTEPDMETVLPEYDLCVDATHPYATEVTRNICSACEKTGIPYVRIARSLNRPSATCGKLYDGVTVLHAPGAEQAAALLSGVRDNILLTTGTKELPAFADLPRDLLYPRVLPSVENLNALEDAGIPKKNIIAMQGPFSTELNVAFIQQRNIKYLVTKNGGKTGGFPEKLEAARQTGVTVVLITPPEDEGISVDEFLKLF